ncbi:hypothetical protein, partial [Methylicorpusculum sp.]|uniref:hypothetical protein n=2 Tax=Methylicorpusculum sp. TaxID=2713644 RepID=UPI002AB9105A
KHLPETLSLIPAYRVEVKIRFRAKSGYCLRCGCCRRWPCPDYGYPIHGATAMGLSLFKQGGDSLHDVIPSTRILPVTALLISVALYSLSLSICCCWMAIAWSILVDWVLM